MNVLSLFDGISCGQVALNRAGIKYDNYYASEIDKNAIKVTMNNYPDTIQLGDVTKWKEWDLPKIDLIIAGSPCQGFSFAGKGLNFDDPRSKLFFDFLHILKHHKPRFFLLENVKMKKEYEDVITDSLGVTPSNINSNLLTAQNRQRLYWTNIPFDINIPTKNLVSQDIVSEQILSKKEIDTIDLLKELNFRNFRTDNSKKRIIGNVRGGDQKINCLTASNTYNPAGCGCSNFVFKTSYGYDWRKINRTECELAQTLPLGYTKVISEGLAKKALGNGWTVDVISHIFKNIS